MLEKLLAKLISELLGKGFAALQEYFNKRKVNKLQKQVSALENKVKILEFEKKKTERIKDWKYRLENGFEIIERFLEKINYSFICS